MTIEAAFDEIVVSNIMKYLKVYEAADSRLVCGTFYNVYHSIYPDNNRLSRCGMKFRCGSIYADPKTDGNTDTGINMRMEDHVALEMELGIRYIHNYYKIIMKVVTFDDHKVTVIDNDGNERQFAIIPYKEKEDTSTIIYDKYVFVPVGGVYYTPLRIYGYSLVNTVENPIYIVISNKVPAYKNFSKNPEANIAIVRTTSYTNILTYKTLIHKIIESVEDITKCIVSFDKDYVNGLVYKEIGINLDIFKKYYSISVEVRE